MAPLDSASQDLLREGVSQIGLDLSETTALGLESFLETLETWAPKLNLVADHTTAILIQRHVLDSLAAAPTLTRCLGKLGTLVDLGSGAGFPGIPLAIFLRPARTILVEPRQRRAHFLRAVARTLPDLAIEVAQSRADSLHLPATADAVCSRATFSDSLEFLALAAPLLRPGGLAIAFQGPNSQTVLPETFEFHPPHRENYRSPGGQTTFHLTIWTRT